MNHCERVGTPFPSVRGAARVSWIPLWSVVGFQCGGLADWALLREPVLQAPMGEGGGGCAGEPRRLCAGVPRGCTSVPAPFPRLCPFARGWPGAAAAPEGADGQALPASLRVRSPAVRGTQRCASAPLLCRPCRRQAGRKEGRTERRRGGSGPGPSRARGFCTRAGERGARRE